MSRSVRILFEKHDQMIILQNSINSKVLPFSIVSLLDNDFRVQMIGFLVEFWNLGWFHYNEICVYHIRIIKISSEFAFINTQITLVMNICLI